MMEELTIKLCFAHVHAESIQEVLNCLAIVTVEGVAKATVSLSISCESHSDRRGI